MSFTKSTVTTNNISALANQPTETAVQLKAKFDQYGVDDKARFNALIDELEATTGTSGAESIGSKTITGLAGNTIWAQLSALWTALQNIVIGTLPDNSVTNDKIATASKIGFLADLTTSVKTNIVAAINSISVGVGDGSVTWPKLAPDMQNRELTQDKAITELLMLADIDSKVFSPNLGKFYSNFSTVMDYSLGAVDATKQSYTGTLSAGATNVVLPSATGFSAGQEISIQDATHYEDIIVSSVVSTTVSFKTPLVNSYTNPTIYRSNNASTNFGDIGVGSVTGSVFGLHFDNNMTDFVGVLTPESDNGTYDTTNKVFGVASKAYAGGQYTQYADSSIFELGSGNWYVDFRVRMSSISSNNYCCGQVDASGTTSALSFHVNARSTAASNKVVLTVAVGGTVYEAFAGVISDNNFHHIRAGRNGNTLYCALDGVVGTGVSITGTVNNSTNKFRLGMAGEYTTFPLNGNLDEFILVKGQPMDSTNFTVPTQAYGGIATTKNVIRMNITPYEDVKYISAWLTKTDLAGFTADGKLSIVDASADESYVDLTESVTDLGATQEVMMIGNTATADSKVTLKLELNRASTSDSVSFTKLIGGVSA